MRRLIVSNLISLDGFSESASKQLDFFVLDEEFFEYARVMLRNADTLLFGRDTYLHMAAYWPSAPRDEIADHMNNLPKIVFSSTLKACEWKNSRLVSGDAGDEVSRLKQGNGKNLVILGSAKLATFLLRKGLIDEYRVLLQPVLIGSGTPMFGSVREKLQLKLMTSRSFASGVTVLGYQKA